MQRKGPTWIITHLKIFFEKETEAHILSQWMDFAGMETTEGKQINY